MMTQKEALEVLKTGANVFLTGEPGSGKTHTVNAYVGWLRERGIEPAITASTGIAATHIGGRTIHSWSGIGIRHALSAYDLDAIAQNRNVVRRVSSASTLIIDEVSMLSAQTLSMVEAVCRQVKRSERPFGGLQTVLVGDFFQLPPVSRKEHPDPEHDGRPTSVMFGEEGEEGGEDGFAFASGAWKRAKLLTCYLSEQHRQDDAGFLALLSALRSGTAGEKERELLHSRFTKEATRGVTELYSHNADVDAINSRALASLKGDAKTFLMTSRGPEKLVAPLKRGCLSPEELLLKVGARVMFTKNDVRGRFVNGTLGEVTGFAQELDGYPVVKTKGGRTVVAEPDEWRVEEGGKVLASITQVPLRLAWAMTVHKSQGMSLDAAHMDLTATFEYGQGYVALSRVRTLSGLSLAGLNARALEVHPEIREKDVGFRAESEVAQDAFRQMNKEELKAMHANFVKASGGKEPEEPEKPRLNPMTDVGRPSLGRAKSGKKRPSREETLECVKKGMGIEEAAEARGFKARTILSHIKECVQEGAISRSEIAHLAEGNAEEIEAIHRACEELGTEKLKPIFEHFEGTYSYDTIQLAVILFKK